MTLNITINLFIKYVSLLRRKLVLYLHYLSSFWEHSAKVSRGNWRLIIIIMGEVENVIYVSRGEVYFILKINIAMEVGV